MSNKSNIYLTAFGLESERVGLVRSVIHARGLSPAHSEAASISAWVGDLSDSEIDTLLESLLKLQNVAFDLELKNESSARRIVFSPNLGLRAAALDEFGCINLTEHHIRALMAEANQNMLKFARLIDQSLLAPWDVEFESIRERALAQEEAVSRSSVA